MRVKNDDKSLVIAIWSVLIIVLGIILGILGVGAYLLLHNFG